jgi:hypothetical protein
VCEDNGAAVRDIQRRLGFPTRFSEPNVGSLAAADVPFRPAPSRPQPGPATAERTRSERPKPERAKGDWPVTAGPAAPRRKPDGRPARNGSRRRSGSSRFRQA